MSVQTEPYNCLNYINGEWKPSSNGKTIASINPANIQEIVGYVQASTIDDLNSAVASAKEAQKAWRKLSGAARGDFLFKAANILEQHLDEVAETMTREMGKTFPEAKGETARGVAILRYYAGEGMRKVGEVIPPSDAQGMMFTTRVPLGVVGVISPWNFPVAIPIWKMAPALIYGNAVVFKAATEAAVTAGKIIECFAKAGFPAGVVNMVNGSGSVIGDGLSSHPDIAGITFTGSEFAGKKVGQNAFARGAKYQLEMGGKNPVIVTNDANLDLAVDATISGAFRSTGQKCTATSRVIVQSGIYEQFKDKLVSKIKEIKIGDGMQPDTWMGPCSSESQMKTVLGYIEKGLEEGANLVHGGKKLSGGAYDNGFYVEPTVFETGDPNIAIVKEEIFGPVIALIRFDELSEGVALANDSIYGLSASIFTGNIEAMMAFIQDMDAGLVRINAESAGVELQAPFGGMKQSSSHSREQGQAAIEFFTSIKTVFVKP